MVNSIGRELDYRLYFTNKVGLDGHSKTTDVACERRSGMGGGREESI